MFVCVFASYISSVTVQKLDTPLAVWHLVKRVRECVCVSVLACTLYVHQRGKGALIIEAPPQSPPSVQSQEAQCFSLIHVKGRKRHTHTTQTRGRGTQKVLLLTEAPSPSSLAHIVYKKEETGGKEEKGIECKEGFLERIQEAES